MTTHTQAISMLRQCVTRLWQDLPQDLSLENDEWARRHLNLAVVIRETVDSFMDRARAKGLLLSCTMEEGIPTNVVGDAVRVRQVLTNLIGNAIKFTEVGSVTVIVQSVPNVSGTFRIAAQDIGIGISEAAQAVLFQEFSQADESSTRKYGGTGMGLAISKRFVEMMHGAIGVEAVTGGGARFWFTGQFAEQGTDGVVTGHDSGAAQIAA